MKIKTHLAKRLAALALAGSLVLGAVPQALAADTIGGADTAQLPVSQEIEQENCIRWLLDLLGLGGSKDKITVDYLNVKGQGLRRNVKLDLVDCLVGITYTEIMPKFRTVPPPRHGRRRLSPSIPIWNIRISTALRPTP